MGVRDDIAVRTADDPRAGAGTALRFADHANNGGRYPRVNRLRGALPARGHGRNRQPRKFGIGQLTGGRRLCVFRPLRRLRGFRRHLGRPLRRLRRRRTVSLRRKRRIDAEAEKSKHKDSGQRHDCAEKQAVAPALRRFRGIFRLIKRPAALPVRRIHPWWLIAKRRLPPLLRTGRIPIRRVGRVARVLLPPVLRISVRPLRRLARRGVLPLSALRGAIGVIRLSRPPRGGILLFLRGVFLRLILSFGFGARSLLPRIFRRTFCGGTPVLRLFLGWFLRVSLRRIRTGTCIRLSGRTIAGPRRICPLQFRQAARRGSLLLFGRTVGVRLLLQEEFLQRIRPGLLGFLRLVGFSLPIGSFPLKIVHAHPPVKWVTPSAPFSLLKAP